MEQEFQQVEKIYDILVEFIVTYSFALLGAVVILLIGLLVARKVADIAQAQMLKRNIDTTLSRFVASVVKVIIIVMFAIISLSNIGISVTPFVAAIGAASLGAGLAFQGLLSNYGAGLTIIVTRPFKIGNTIRVQGVSGVVKDIFLGYTILTNEEEQEITIPNRHIVGEILHNSFANTLVSGVVGIAYSSNVELALNSIADAINQSGQVDKSKLAQVGIDEFADSSINIGYRCWVPTENYYQHKYAINALVYKTLQEQGITIPFPQREVRMLGN